MPGDVQVQAVQVGPAVICAGSLRQRDPAIFSGIDEHDIEDWLASYERVSIYNKWDDETKLHNIIFYLTIVANLWFRNHEVDIQTWPTVKTNFTQVFGPPAVRNLRAEQSSRDRSEQVGESFTSYIEDVVDLCKRVNLQMLEADRIRHILKGIDDDAFHVLPARDLRSVADVTLCQSFKELRKQRSLTRQQPKQVESLAGLTPAADSSPLQQIKDFVHEEVTCQLSRLSSMQGPPPHLAPALRHVIQEQVAEALPTAHPPPPVTAPLTYAEVVARPRPPTQHLHQMEDGV